jgi:hypothetical protein
MDDTQTDPCFKRTVGRCQGCPPGEGVTTLEDGLCLTHRAYGAYNGADSQLLDFDD